MSEVLAWFLDWLLGPRCHRCAARVFPADCIAHYSACTRRV